MGGAIAAILGISGMAVVVSIVLAVMMLKMSERSL